MTKKKKSSLVQNTFLDTKGLQRANCRLKNSSLTYNECHPIIAPEKLQLATLYLCYVHLLMLHGDHRLTQQIIRQELYISRLKPQIKKNAFSCVSQVSQCTSRKFERRYISLSPERCNFAPPFSITGVDFARPFQIKASILRSPILMDYVCFTAKFGILGIRSLRRTSRFSRDGDG